MKKLNVSEDVDNTKQARAEAITWAEKAYPDISQKANQRQDAAEQNSSAPKQVLKRIRSLIY